MERDKLSDLFRFCKCPRDLHFPRRISISFMRGISWQFSTEILQARTYTLQRSKEYIKSDAEVYISMLRGVLNGQIKLHMSMEIE